MNVVISNSIDDEGNFSEKALQREFIVYMEPLGNRRQLVRSVGWWMPAQVRQILEHKIRVVARADPSNPERAAGPLLYALRETAKDSQESVGKAALLASLPRCAVPSPGVVTGPMDNLDFRRQAVSLYLPDKVKNPHDAATYVPALIGPRLMAVGLKVRPGTEPPVMNSRDGY